MAGCETTLTGGECQAGEDFIGKKGFRPGLLHHCKPFFPQTTSGKNEKNNMLVQPVARMFRTSSIYLSIYLCVYLCIYIYYIKPLSQ